MRVHFILIAALIFSISACDQSAPAHFEVSDTETGVNGDGYIYLDITVKNTSSGAGKNVMCKITVTEERSDTVLSEETILFESGDTVLAGEETERRVTLYHQSALDPLIEYEDMVVGGVFESIPLDPIITYDFELSWEEVGL